MSRRRLPEIRNAVLRDYTSSAESTAVWRRLKAELRAHRPSPRRSALVWMWAPALAAVLFGSGVIVGARLLRPQALALVRAEPRAESVQAPAAATPQAAQVPEPTLGPIKSSHTRARRLSASAAASAEPVAGVVEELSTQASVTPSAAPEWQRLVEIGDFAGARRALDRQGGFDVAMARATPAELMSLVDIARASSDRGQAISALRQVLAHPDAPEAPLAAWTLGNLLDQAGDQPGAAQAFALYRRLSPAGDFAQDAAARQIDVALAQGNAELVTQLVEDYARDFPHGRRLTEFRRAESALASREADAGPKASPRTDDVEDEADDVHNAPAPAPSTSDPDVR